VTYENKGGAAGALGLAQFLNQKGDPNAMMVMGAVMLGGIITGRQPVTLTQCTPLARLTSEYNVFVLPANSPFKTMADVVAQLKKDPGSVKWGGGSRGSTEHIAAAMIAARSGRGPGQDQLRGLPWGRGSHRSHPGRQRHRGRQRLQRICRIHHSGKMRAVAVTSATRLKGVDVPTLKEQGINVEIGNWRGVYGAPGITADQRKELIDLITKAIKSKAWAEALEKNNWTPAVLTGDAFTDFVDRDFASLRATMVKSGMI
jgi:putative tricarboxylic transport membrane protein